MNKERLVLGMTALGAIGGAFIGAIGGNLPEALQIAEICAIPLLVILGLVALRVMIKKGYLSTQNQYLVLWFLLIVHRSFVQRSEAVDVQTVSLSSNFAEIGITLLVFAGAMAALARRLTKEKRFVISGSIRFLVAYVSFAVISILWTANPFYAGFWLIRLVSVAAILALYFEEPSQVGIERFMGTTLLGLLPIIGAPIVYSLQGSLAYSNRIIAGWLLPGAVSTAAAAIGVYSILKHIQTPRVHWVALVIVSFWSLFLASGKAGALAVPVSLLLVLVVTRRLRLATRMAAVVVLAAIVLALNWSSLAEMGVGLISHTQAYVESGDFGTLYGRFNLWAGALQTWGASPLTFLFGYGYMSARITGITSLSRLWTMTHAHNSFIQTFFESGLIGAIPLLIFILSPTLHAIRQARRPSNEALAPLLAGMFVLLIGSMTDEVFGGLLHAGFYLIVALAVSMDATLSLSRVTEPAISWDNRAGADRRPVPRPSAWMPAQERPHVAAPVWQSKRK